MSSGGRGKALHPAAGCGESPSARGPPCAGEGTPAATACLPGDRLRRVRTALGLPPPRCLPHQGIWAGPLGLGSPSPFPQQPVGTEHQHVLPTVVVRMKQFLLAVFGAVRSRLQAAGRELTVTAKRAVRAEGSGACVRPSRRGFVPTALPASLAQE